MALTKLRIKVGSTWYTATLNSSTGLYEATVTAPTVSGIQNVAITAEATNSDGQVTNYDTTAEVRQELTAPVFTLNSPAAGAWSANQHQPIVFTVTDAGVGVSVSTVKLTLDGTTYAYNAAGMTYTAVTGGYQFTYVPQTALAAGDHTFSVSAADTIGNSGTSASRTFKLDPAYSTLVVTSPTDQQLINTDTVTVTGTATDTTSGTPTVKVNGTVATLTGGAFTATVPISEGQNTITVTATTPAGSVTTVTRTVIRDTTAPTVTITAPTEGGLVGSNTVTVTGTAEDSGAGVTALTVNGETVTPAAAWSHTLTLEDGQHTVTVVAVDRAGNSNSASVSFTVDASPPEIVLTSPADGLITNQTEITVTGSVSDTATGVSSLAVNGEAVTPAEDGSFSTSLTYTDGTHTITVTAADGAGNLATVTRTVQVDTVPPTLTVATPTDGLVTNDNTVDVTGTTEAGATLLVNGETVEVEGGAFAVTIPYADGHHTLTVTARDAAGNETTVSRALLVDVTVPALSVEYPATDIVTNQAVFDVTGTVGDTLSGLAEVTVNGVAVEVTDGRFSRTMEFADGQHTVTVVAVDNAGNRSEVVRAVRVDTVPPEIIYVEILPDLEADPIGWDFILAVQMGAPDTPETVTATFHGSPVTLVHQGNNLYKAALRRPENDFVGWGVAVTATDQAGNRTDWERDFDCGLGCRWDWTPIDFLNAPDLNRVERNTEFLRTTTITHSPTNKKLYFFI